MFPSLPRFIPGTKQELSPNLTVSVLTDRHLVLELGVAVVANLSPEEVQALRTYLNKHFRKWTVNK